MGYDLSKVKPWVAAAANEIGPKFGIKDIGGWSATGSVPNSDHPKGLALDLMTLNHSTGNGIVEYGIANAERLGITYIIYWGRIWTASTNKWKTYSGPSPHVDHVHISFSANGDSNVGVGGTVIPAALPAPYTLVLDQLEGLAARVGDPALWKRVGLYVGGATLVVLGSYGLARGIDQ